MDYIWYIFENMFPDSCARIWLERLQLPLFTSLLCGTHLVVDIYFYNWCKPEQVNFSFYE